MTHFELGAGETSIAERHRTVSEMWYVRSGLGRMWRQPGDDEPGGIHLRSGTALTPPVGTSIQFPSTGRTPLAAVGVTMLPWPGDGEAVEVQGPRPPSLSGDRRRR